MSASSLHTSAMEAMPLVNVRKAWRRHVANTGSIADAQCYKDHMQKICHALTVAFAPLDDLATVAYKGQSNTHEQPNQQKLADTPPPDGRDPATLPQSTKNVQPADHQTIREQTGESQGTELAGNEMQKNDRMGSRKAVVDTQDVEMQDVDEQPFSGSDQPIDKTDKASVAIAEKTNDNKTFSCPATVAVAEAEAQSQAAARLEAVRPPFYSAPLKPAHAELRGLYLNLLYHDRFLLLSRPTFLLFLSEQPHLSHGFLRHLIGHRFGIRYVHRDGGNANHGIIPFQFPFLPAHHDLPLSSYFDYRWVLLNDPTWLAWVSFRESVMAGFWAEMSFRGGLGVMQRRKGVAERASQYAVSPL